MPLRAIYLARFGGIQVREARVHYKWSRCGASGRHSWTPLQPLVFMILGKLKVQ